MGCGNCNGNCASCSGCAGAMTLTEAEIRMLRRLGQIPFLPIARRADSMDPVFLEDALHTREEYSLILQCMEKKGLITLDYDQPLTNFDAAAYAAYPLRGSMALTTRGQQILELMELQGIQEE